MKNVGCGPLFTSVHPNIYFRTKSFPFSFPWLYVNSWGRAKEDLKNRSERSSAHSCLLGERGAMKDPVSEVIEVANAK